MDLRPYQTDAIDRLRQSIAAGRKRIMLQAACFEPDRPDGISPVRRGDYRRWGAAGKSSDDLAIEAGADLQRANATEARPHAGRSGYRRRGPQNL